MNLKYTAPTGNRSPGYRISSTAQHHQGADHSEAEERPFTRVDIKGDWVAAEGDQGLRGRGEDVSLFVLWWWPLWPGTGLN